MKKRLLTLAIAAIMAAMSCFAFIGCSDDGGGETAPPDTFYKGTLSTETYTSKDNAAQAFLAAEVDGNTTETTFRSYEKTADLSEEEIAELDLTEEELASVTGAEKGVVKYNEGTASEGKAITIYILLDGSSAYRYYVPELKSGDTVTKSYFDLATDVKNLSNCTITEVSTSGGTLTATQGSMKESRYVEVKVVTTLKVAGKYMYGKVATSNNVGMAGSTIEVFGVFVQDVTTETSHTWFNTNNSGWQTGGNIKFSDYFKVAEDHTYFVKTTSGFKLSEDRFSDYMGTALAKLEGMKQYGLIEDQVRASCYFNVFDGKLSKIQINVSCPIDGNSSGVRITGTVNATCTDTFSDYGTTVVTVPEGITVPQA